MAGGARRGTNKTYTLIQSAVTPIAGTINLAGLDVGKPHCFAGIQFFADAEGLIEAIPTTGTVLVRIQTLNTTPRYEDPPSNTVQAALPTTVTWDANTLKATAIPTGVDVATHYRLVITCNET